MGDEEREIAAEATESGATGPGDTGGNSGPEGSRRRLRPDRAGLLAGAALLATCGGLVLYGVLDTTAKPAKHPVPTAAVTYEVTGEGTADIAYQGGSEAGKATVDRAATLPWRRTVRVPLGRPPLVSITLGEKGGRVSCSLAVRGRHVQTASAYGKFGRATCQAELPSPTPTAAAG